MEREAEMMTLLSIPIHPRATDEDIVEELFHQFWFEWGAQLGNAAFFSRNIPPLVAAYGHDAVDRALKLHHRQMRSATSFQIRQQQAYARRLRRSAEGL
jgi:hypothetical protein